MSAIPSTQKEHPHYQAYLPVGLYLLLSVLYLFAVPTGESPDEPSHLNCVEQVSQYNRLPEIDPIPIGLDWSSRGRIVSGVECYQMPLYYLLGGYIQQVVGSITNTPVHLEIPPNNPDWGKSPAMFLHNPKVSYFTFSELPATVAVRVMSILLGLVILWVSYRIVGVILPHNETAAVLAATLTAGWPLLIYMSRAINNDVLATALAVLVLITLMNARQPRRFIVASFWSALAILSKSTMVFTSIVVIAIYLAECLTPRTARKDYIIPGVIGLVIFLILTSAIRFQPTLFNHFNQTQMAIANIDPSVTTASYWIDVVRLSLSSGWARFGWMNLPAPDWQVYFWWLSLSIGGFIGLRAVLVRSEEKVSRIILLALGLWVVGAIAIYVRINLNRFQPQFRYVLPLIPVLSAFAAVGIFTVFGNLLQRRWVILVATAFVLLATNIWIIFGLIVPAYS